MNDCYTAPSLTEIKKPTLIDKLTRTESALHSICREVDALREKLLGPFPQCDGGCTVNAKPGILEQSDINLTLAETLVKELGDLVERL